MSNKRKNLGLSFFSRIFVIFSVRLDLSFFWDGRPSGKKNIVQANFPLSYQVLIWPAASIGQYLQIPFSDFRISTFLSISIVSKNYHNLKNFTRSPNLRREQGFKQLPLSYIQLKFGMQLL